MPKDQSRLAVPRQRPVSCRLCRTRKLRCSRTNPCTNCVSRNVECDFEETTTQPDTSQSDLLARLRRVEELLDAQDVGDENPNAVVDYTQSRVLESMRRPNPACAALFPEIQSFASDVAWLETIFISNALSDKIRSDIIVLKDAPILKIPELPTCAKSPTGKANEPARCIWLPQIGEAKILLDKYIEDLDYSHHVTHTPSLHSTLQEVYIGLAQHTSVKPGSLLLLLGIFASGTYYWTAEDTSKRDLFPDVSTANSQAPVWVRAMENVVDISHRCGEISVEGIQGIMISLFVIMDIEGFSRRGYSMFSRALFLARDLGLHRIDHPSNADKANTAKAEIGRRMWWYLATTDWVIAARFSDGAYTCHPRQMMTNKPLHINDEDLFDEMSRNERPRSEPTVMSYSMHRIEIGELSRRVVDRMPLSMGNRTLSIDEVMDLDTEFQMIENSIPSFFSMSPKELMDAYNVRPNIAHDIFHQRYIMTFLFNAARTKLHLPYLIESFIDRSYTASKDICLRSARLVIRSVYTERIDLYRSRASNLTYLLVGVFMASIVLLMDLCMTNSISSAHRQREEVAKAFRVLEEAKKESDTANKFVQTMMQILQKHKIAPPKPNEGEHVGMLPTPTYSETTSSSVHNHAGLGDLDMDMPLEQADLTAYLNGFTQNFEQGMDIGNFDWPNLFSDLDSSFI